jgi:hypothetical protein
MMGIVLVKRASLQNKFNTVEMASWTACHHGWVNLQDWLAEFVPSAYVRSVSVLVHNRTHWLVDRQLLPVDTKTADLCVGVGEVTALQQRIVGKADTRDNMTSTEGDLFGLREILIRLEYRC